MDIRNRSVLITGGSRGLGRALGEVFASEGARVVLAARNAAELDRTVEDIRRAGAEVYGIAADIAGKNDAHRIAGEAAALAGPIDILFQNASTLGPVPLRLLLDTDCEDLERVLQVNLVGPFRLQKIIVGSMALRGQGLVVTISSDAAVEAYSRWGAYGVSKAALDHMTRIWAAELAQSGVRFLSIDPGEMNTRMHADAAPAADPADLADPRDVARRIAAAVRDIDRFKNGDRIVAAAMEVVR